MARKRSMIEMVPLKKNFYSVNDVNAFQDDLREELLEQELKAMSSGWQRGFNTFVVIVITATISVLLSHQSSLARFANEVDLFEGEISRTRHLIRETVPQDIQDQIESGRKAREEDAFQGEQMEKDV